MEWRVAQLIVETLLEDTRMGFTGQFRSEWWDSEKKRLVYVSLSMLQRIGPGRVGHDG